MQQLVEDALLFKVDKVGWYRLRVVSADDKKSGWVSRDHVAALPDALDSLTNWIKANPTNSHGYVARARAYASKEEWDKALADLDEAIRLAPGGAHGPCRPRICLGP